MKRALAMVIINYNDAPTTIRLLKNIKHYHCLSRILVVDNHSTDDSYQVIKKLEKGKIKVIQTKENKGFAAGLNEGAKILKKEFQHCDIIFSNADIMIYSDENLKLLQKTLQKKDIALVGPVVCEHNHLNRGWRLPTPKQEVLSNLPVIGTRLQNKFQRYQEEHYQEDVSIVEAVSGCFFLISLETLEAVHYFDENTFLYYEENIMAKKLKDFGKKVAVCNEVTVIHDHSVSVDKSVSYINKFKLLKSSQLYFEKTYNEAKKVDLFFLKFFAKLTLITLYIRVFFKGGLKGRK